MTLLNAIRYGLPALLLLVGVVCLFTVHDSAKLEAWGGFTGAGLSVFILNYLFRLGVEDDERRGRAEESARAHFDEHGEWPEEDHGPKRRQWVLPEGVQTPDDEERR